MKNLWNVVKNNAFMLRYVLKYAPALVVYKCLLSIFIGFMNTFTGVYVGKFILDSFQNGRAIREVIVFLLLVLLGFVAQSVLSAHYGEMYSPGKKELLYWKMHTELFEKAKGMELSCYDNPEFFNDFVWAISQADGKACDVLDNTGEFLKNLARIESTIGIILQIDVMGICAAMLMETACFIMGVIGNRLSYEQSQKQIPMQRKRDYISRILYHSDYAKEIRLSSVKKKLVKDFVDSNKSLKEILRFYGKRIMCVYSVGFVLRHLVRFVYTGYLMYLALVLKTITYGGFMALYNGVQELNDSVYSMSDAITQFQKRSLYIECFRTFWDYEPKMKDGVDTLLTKEFSKDGVNLSGGEAQKVAIARVFPRDSRVVVLDEPSSALDPVTE